VGWRSGWQERFYADLVARWTDLRLEVETLQVKTAGLSSDKRVPDHIAERLQMLGERRNTIEARESAPWKRLLRRCQEDQTEETWGAGIRTAEDVEAELGRRSEPRIEPPADR
jgi:hypothetical protein